METEQTEKTEFFLSPSWCSPQIQARGDPGKTQLFLSFFQFFQENTWVSTVLERGIQIYLPKENDVLSRPGKILRIPGALEIFYKDFQKIFN